MGAETDFRIYTDSEVERMSDSEKVARILEMQETVVRLGAACQSLIGRNERLEAQMESLEAQIKRLEQQIKELQARLNQNSTNSSKPPSSDGLGKRPVKNLRTKSGRKPGGQPGHAGHTLPQVEKPDHTQEHAPGACACGHVFTPGATPERIERYQVFDLPTPRLEVTEHQIQVCTCPDCGRTCKGTLPPGVSPAPVQYGTGVLALAVYLRVYQLLPYERISEFCEHLFGLPMSKATIEAAEKRMDGELGPFLETLRAVLTEAPVLHADETGVRVENETRWLHVLATAQWTLYQVHDKRGKEAMDAQGILPVFGGTLIHDCWGPYFKYPCAHGLCNEHLLRELKFAHEELGQAWALEMYEFLLYVHGLVNAPSAGPLSAEALASLGAMYEDILARGAGQLPPDPPKTGARGRAKKSKARNLHERLSTHRASVLLFALDPRVDFTNNIAEQAVRMAKVQQKISGCMRTTAGAQRFARLRSYVSTVKKHGEKVFPQIRAAISGVPYLSPQNAGCG